MSLWKKSVLAAACAGGIAAAGQASAANWLMLQGTEPAGAAARAKVWGFIQAQYQDDSSDPNPAGGYIPPKLIPPNLESQSAFNVNRARLGARGTGFPLDPNVNYFLLVEFGNNGITKPGDSFAKASDASITLNHIKGARVRMGLFKYPGAEEGLQAIHVFDYINFTTVSNQLLLERFPESTYDLAAAEQAPPQTLPPGQDLNAFSEGVGAFRDVGVQVFDTFKLDNNWEVAYAAMLGNGNGLNFSDNDDNKDGYLYLSAEKVYGGRGPFIQSMKFWGWIQRGERTADLTNDGTHNPVEYDRDRSGVGFKYNKRPWRVTAEYMEGDGMIFVGPDKPTFGIGPAAGNPNHPGNGANGEADGWYVEGGYRINTNWEVDLRYDVYNRLKDSMFEMEFKTTTLGVQYHFNKKTRAKLNYAIRDFEAVNFPGGAGPNANLDGVDDRIAVEVTHIF